MLKKIIALPLLISVTIAGINISFTQPVKAELNDSILYICLTNQTDKKVYIASDDNINGSFFVEAQPNGRYWWWRRRKRSSNREISISLNGKNNQAEYKWTRLKPEQIGLDQACFFNEWEIKENPDGDLFLSR